MTEKLTQVMTDVATLNAEMRFLKERVNELEEECKKLEQWKAMCTTTAAAWGVFLVAVSSVFGVISHYWDTLSSIFAKLK